MPTSEPACAVHADRPAVDTCSDPVHPGVRRALERAGEDASGVVVLLAAIYGAVTRALEQVTDQDEETLVVALLEHLPLVSLPDRPSA